MIIEQIPMDSDVLSNSFILKDEKTGACAIADPGGCTEGLVEAVEREKDNIKYILLTHGHFDHILALPFVKEKTNALVAIGEGDAICLKSRVYNLMERFNVDAPFTETEPDIILKDGDKIKIGESEITALSVPGHSAGGFVFVDEDGRNIITGDTLFRSTVGRTDGIGGSDEELRKSLVKLISLDGDYDIYPGHGPKSELSHERVRNIYIRRMNK